MTLPDYASMRLPQRRGEPTPVSRSRPCPVRPEDRILFAHEIPHAVTWLFVRGDTVNLAYSGPQGGWRPTTTVGHRYMVTQFFAVAMLPRYARDRYFDHALRVLQAAA